MNLTKLNEPQTYNGLEFSPNDSRGSDTYQLASDVCVTLSFRENLTFWASAARPHPTISDFAVATGIGTLIVRENESSWDFDSIQKFAKDDLDAPSEVLAIDWLDQNILLNGFRDGKVRLWDVRTNGIDGTSLRICQPQCVAHVRKMNEYKVVVRGIEDQVRRRPQISSQQRSICGDGNP